MDVDWDDLRVFCVAAQTPTFSAAARRLGTAVATVARRIATLEAQLGVRLFDRSPGGTCLTTQGRALLASASQAAAAMEDVGRVATGLRTQAWTEPIRISATEPVISEILAPALPSLLAAVPNVRVDLVASTEVVSLAAREADVAIRFARPVGDSLVARSLPGFALGLFAARTYLAGRRPEDLDLRRERMLGYDASYGRIAEVVWMEDVGLSGAVIVRSSSTRALIRAAVAGVGVALLPRVLVRREGGLIEIPAPKPIPERRVWLVSHRDLKRAQPLRIVRDWIARACREASVM